VSGIRNEKKKKECKKTVFDITATFSNNLLSKYYDKRKMSTLIFVKQSIHATITGISGIKGIRTV